MDKSPCIEHPFSWAGVGILSGIALTIAAMWLGLYGFRGGWTGCRLHMSPEQRVRMVTAATDEFVITRDRCPGGTEELVRGVVPS